MLCVMFGVPIIRLTHSCERRESRAATADSQRPGSRAAVLDERASGHALRLRASEEGSGFRARSSRAERAIRQSVSSSQ
jgi:hypothetical protein